MNNKIVSLLLGLSLCGFLFSLSGCACWTDASKNNTPGCIVAHEIVDCSVGAVESAMPYFVNIIGGLINGGVDPSNIPWDNIVKQAEAMGIKDGGCFLAELKNQFFGPAAEEPMRMAMGSSMAGTKLSALRQKTTDLLTDYKVKHLSANVRFRIKDAATGKVVEL